MGYPANAALKKARIKAHDSFDRLWKSNPSRHSRGRAYARISELMGRTIHISWTKTVEECEEIARVAEAEYQRCLSEEKKT